MSISFSKEEQQQYSRHLILDEIGAVGQQKLKDAKVLVIGAGGLSCPVLQYLAAAGVGKIGIVDGDRIEQSNLQRQVLFSHEDIGKFKAEVAAQKLAKLNPYVHFYPHLEMLDKRNVLKLFAQGKSYALIAKELNINTKTVDNMLFRIRKKLAFLKK